MPLIEFASMYGFVAAAAIPFTDVVLRLGCAAVLGGVLGLEREVRRKAAGLRTNMFICVGSALFTILSEQLSVAWGGDNTRIASYIVAGIGFIGGGAILHSEGAVKGLTTAATLFVGAAIGMAAGGGLYKEAGFATAVVFVALYILGQAERRFSIKQVHMTYEVAGNDVAALIDGINFALEDIHKMMQKLEVVRTVGHARVQFVIDATRKEHQRLLPALKQIPGARNVLCLGVEESE